MPAEPGPSPQRPARHPGGPLLLLAGLSLAVAVGGLGWHLGKPGDPAAVPPPRVKPLPPPMPPPVPAETVIRPPAPGFDIVRIDRDGRAVMAGRAPSGAEVAILDGQDEIGRVRADANGEWVFAPVAPLAPGTRELRLRTRNRDGSVAESGAPVVLVLPARREQPALALRVVPDGPGMEQGPSAAAGAGGLRLDVATQLGTHGLYLAGKATPAAALHLYYDNRFVGRVEADDTGSWRHAPRLPVTPMPHTFRVDQLGPGGEVVARVELPFVPPGAALLFGGEVTSRAGDGAWEIFRNEAAWGLDFSVVYRNDHAQARDPAAIYPGQVFQP